MGRNRALAGLVLAWAAALRLSGIAWDGWQQQHPDERFLAMVAAKLEAPHSLGAALDPQRSPLNPNNQGFSFYVYGGLPPVLNHAAAAAIGRPGIAGVLVAGRLLAGLVDVVTTFLVMILAARLAGARSGLVAGLLYASCPLMVQQARFATVDGWATMFATLAAVAVVGRRSSPIRLLACGSLVGLAAACKPNLVLALAIPLAALAVSWWDDGRRLRGLVRVAGVAMAIAAAAAVTLKIADPGAFAATWSFLPSPRRVEALRQLGAVVRGLGQYPPNLQWADRRFMLDPLVNLLLWGMGPFLGLAVVGGVSRVVRRAALGDRRWLPLLAWVLPASAVHLVAFVASVRHFEPFVPVLVVAAGAWLASRRRWLGATVVGGTAVVGLVFASMAWRPYTRLEASRWMAKNLPPGATVTAEYWDDALPLPGEGPPGVRILTMRVFDPDSAAKRDQLAAALDSADAVVLSSQRGVGSICRVPDAYPITSEYYHLLFSGALGFKLAAHFERRIGVGPLSFSDLSAEETLSVYDHPPVWIFVKTSRYSPDLTRRLLDRPSIGPPSWETRDLEARGQPPWEMRWSNGGELPGALTSGAARQVVGVVCWVVWVELAGLLGGWIVRRVAPRLPDGGWGLARWVGFAGLGLVWMWCGWVGVPGWNAWLPTTLTVIAIPFAVRPFLRAWRERRYRQVALLTWGVFLLFAVIRAWNPEVYWGEKPMDASILASIWRADRVPVGDPWMAGASLDYYYFGYLPYALAARALHIAPGVAFNLIAATVPALAASCAASVGWLLAGSGWGAGLAALLAQLGGTAAAVFHPSFLARPEFNSFWATSRVIPDTINEYPVWTALFADLHAHFFAFPGFLAAIALASALALGGTGRLGIALLGAVIGVEAITNTWELPVLLGLLGAAVLFGRPGQWRWRAAMKVGGQLARALGAGLLCTAPFWLTTRTAAAGIAWNHARAVDAGALLELFGVPASLAVVALASTLLAPRAGRELGWAWIVVGAGVGAIALPEFVTVADRMNSVFKLHLQAQLLLATGVAGVLAATVPRLPRRLSLGARALAGVVVGASLLTTISDVRAVVTTRRVAGPRPTLDGNAYLTNAFPARAEVLGRLADLRYAGTVAEPPGPPYSDTLRVPMFSGEPAVVGWPYHLWQRRKAWAELAMRGTDLGTILSGTDSAMVAALAARYRLVGAVTWDGHAPAVARALGWPGVALGRGAGLFLAPVGVP